MSYVESFAHVAVLVSDIGRSAQWYADVLGWEQTFAHDTDDTLGQANGVGGRGRIAMGEVKGTRIELVEMNEADLPSRDGVTHHGLMMLSVRVDDIDAARRHVTDLGVTVVRDLAMGVTPLLVVTDPDGQEICLVGRPGTARPA